jgi:hypothetical protein
MLALSPLASLRPGPVPGREFSHCTVQHAHGAHAPIVQLLLSTLSAQSLDVNLLRSCNLRPEYWQKNLWWSQSTAVRAGIPHSSSSFVFHPQCALNCAQFPRTVKLYCSSYLRVHRDTLSSNSVPSDMWRPIQASLFRPMCAAAVDDLEHKHTWFLRSLTIHQYSRAGIGPTNTEHLNFSNPRQRKKQKNSGQSPSPFFIKIKIGRRGTTFFLLRLSPLFINKIIWTE